MSPQKLIIGKNMKHENVACFKYGVNGHMLYKCCYIKHDSSLFKRIWVPKGSHILSNHKEPKNIGTYFFQIDDCVCRLNKSKKKNV